MLYLFLSVVIICILIHWNLHKYFNFTKAHEQAHSYLMSYVEIFNNRHEQLTVKMADLEKKLSTINIQKVFK